MMGTLIGKNPEFKERSSARNLVLAITLASGASYFGYYISVTNPLNNKYYFQKAFDIDLDDTDRQNEVIGNINLLFSLGAMIGVLTSGFIADFIGRTKTLIFADILAIVSGLGYLFKVDPWVIYIVRFCGGIVAAFYSSVNANLAGELLPQSKSTVTGTAIYSSLTGFILITSFMPQIDE